MAPPLPLATHQAIAGTTQAGEGVIEAALTVALAFTLLAGVWILFRTEADAQTARHISTAVAYGLPDSRMGTDTETAELTKIAADGRKSTAARWKPPIQTSPKSKSIRSSSVWPDQTVIQGARQDHFEHVAACSPNFCWEDRRRWLAVITLRWQTNPASMRFRTRVAEGGRTRSTPPYNQTRDCVFSPQGQSCSSQTDRAPGAVFQTFTALRKASAAIQISLCAAEACAKAPYPPACAAAVIATGVTALSPDRQPPAQCPIFSQSMMTAFGAGKTLIRAAELAQKRESLCTTRRVLGIAHAAWLCPDEDIESANGLTTPITKSSY
jgi:hypothetical protein